MASDQKSLAIGSGALSASTRTFLMWLEAEDCLALTPALSPRRGGVPLPLLNTFAVIGPSTRTQAQTIVRVGSLTLLYNTPNKLGNSNAPHPALSPSDGE